MFRFFLSFFIIASLAIGASAQSDTVWGGLEHDTDLRTITGSAPTKSATNTTRTEIGTVTIFSAAGAEVTAYKPIEVILTERTKMVRYVIPDTAGSATYLAPQSFAGYDKVNFQWIDWSSGSTAFFAGSASSTIRINASLYPSIRKPGVYAPAVVREVTPRTTADGANTFVYDISTLGHYEVINPINYGQLYLTVSNRTAAATEEIIIVGRRTKVED